MSYIGTTRPLVFGRNGRAADHSAHALISFNTTLTCTYVEHSGTGRPSHGVFSRLSRHRLGGHGRDGSGRRRLFGRGDISIVAVCQPSVPVMAAVSVMEADDDPYVPHAMVLMGGPIDTRVNPTAVNNLAAKRGIDWFRNHVITKVPFPNPGFMRDVYPGFLQLNGFMSMNLDRHIEAHKQLFMHLVRGDGDSAQKHREFYDEYLAVMDLSAEFYLQTVDTVFVRHDLPKGEMTHRGRRVDPGRIKRVALLTVEGEHDDISGVGQTEAAHRLCANIPPDRQAHWLQPGVGHYGVFNGSRFRSEIAPRISDFVLSMNQPTGVARARARSSNGATVHTA